MTTETLNLAVSLLERLLRDHEELRNVKAELAEVKSNLARCESGKHGFDGDYCACCASAGNEAKRLRTEVQSLTDQLAAERSKGKRGDRK